MNDKEFEGLMQGLQQYLEKDKTFVLNPDRAKDVERALEIANQLFPDNTTTANDDPLQMGACIVRIEGDDVTVRGQDEINLFCEMIELADNFEIYALTDDTIRFAAVFKNVLIAV